MKGETYEKDILIIVLVIVGLVFLEWIITVGIIKLITMCFGWTFKWSVATGIWLIICILQSIFKSNINVKR